MKKNMYKRIFCAVFLLILLAPLCNMNNAAESEKENRKLAAVPSLIANGEVNKNFCKDTEAWLRDRFWGRDSFLSANHAYALALKDRFSERAIIGEGGWIFYKGNDSIANFQNKNLFTEAELEAVKNTTLKKKAELEKAGIKYYLMVCPDKNRVYGEFYPTFIQKAAEHGRAEQMAAYLRANGIDVIYPLEEMMAAKSEGTLYHRIDTHWTGHGAFIGYTALMKAIQKDYPDLKMLTMDDYDIEQTPETTGDLLGMVNVSLEELEIPDNHITELKLKREKYNYYITKHEGKYGRSGVKTLNDAPLNNYNVFMVRDSYTIALIPYISESFKSVNYAWTRDFKEYFGSMKKDKPDIVIEQLVERYVPVLTNNFK